MQNPPRDDTPPHPILVLVERLDDCWARYRAELKRTRRDFADEYVHDLRVSIRRLIAVIDMGRSVVRQKQLKKTRRLLKSQLDVFDALRDTQVQLTIVDELQDEFPEIGPYRDYLRRREERLISRISRKIKTFRYGGLSQQVSRLRKSLVSKDIPEAEIAVWSAADEAYALVLQRKLLVRVDDMVTIHRLRLAFKQFRYRVECLFPLLLNPPADLLRRLHECQAMMGEIQDFETALQMLAEFTAKTGAELPALVTRLNQVHAARIHDFVDGMPQIETMWRATPLRKLPWLPRRHAKSLETRETS